MILYSKFFLQPIAFIIFILFKFDIMVVPVKGKFV